MPFDLYETLGVAADATHDEIKAAGRVRQKATHPDAGGDAEAFQVVQKALVVLLDPVRRAHYDATGEAQPNSRESRIAAEAAALLAHMMNQVMAEGDPRHVNLAKRVVEKLKEQAATFRAQRTTAEMQKSTAVTKLEGFLKRLTKKDGGDRRMIEILEGQIANHKREAATFTAQVDDKLLSVEAALALAEGYEYAVEPPTPTPTLNMRDLEELLRSQSFVQPGGFFRPRY